MVSETNKVQCSECGKSFFRQGLAMHKILKHGVKSSEKEVKKSAPVYGIVDEDLNQIKTQTSILNARGNEIEAKRRLASLESINPNSVDLMKVMEMQMLRDMIKPNNQPNQNQDNLQLESLRLQNQNLQAQVQQQNQMQNNILLELIKQSKSDNKNDLSHALHDLKDLKEISKEFSGEKTGAGEQVLNILGKGLETVGPVLQNYLERKQEVQQQYYEVSQQQQQSQQSPQQTLKQAQEEARMANKASGVQYSDEEQSTQPKTEQYPKKDNSQSINTGEKQKNDPFS